MNKAKWRGSQVQTSGGIDLINSAIHLQLHYVSKYIITLQAAWNSPSILAKKWSLCQSDEKHKFYSIRVQEKMQIARPKQSHRLSTWNDHIQRYSAALAKTTDQTTHTHPFNGPFLGLPGWAGTRKVKPIWILLKQETVSGRGISWTVCKSAPRSRQITMSAPHHSLYWSDKEQKIKTIIRTNGSTSSLAWKRYSPPLLSLSRNTFGFFV